MKKTIFYRFSVIILSVVFLLGFSSDTIAYIVKSGDTLGKIARENNTTVDNILALNDISDPNMIFPGQDINLGTEGSGYNKVALSGEQKEALESIFDPEWYKEAYPDVVAAMGDSDEAMFEHYIECGLWETRQPCEAFNVNAYASSYGDLRDAFSSMNDAQQVVEFTLHYANYGKEEGREATIEAALEKVDEVTYFGSFHKEEVANTQTGDVVASKPKAAAPANTGMCARINAMYAKIFSKMLELDAKYAGGTEDELKDLVIGFPAGNGLVMAIEERIEYYCIVEELKEYTAEEDFEEFCELLADLIGLEETDPDVISFANELMPSIKEYKAEYETICGLVGEALFQGVGGDIFECDEDEMNRRLSEPGVYCPTGYSDIDRFTKTCVDNGGLLTYFAPGKNIDEAFFDLYEEDYVSSPLNALGDYISGETFMVYFFYYMDYKCDN